MPTPELLARALAAAIDAAAASEQPILSRFRSRSLHVEHKSDGSPVSEADRAAEAVIRRVLADALPDIPVLGEEQGYDGPADAPLRWVVDPIDGTISFINGVPLFGTILGLEDTRSGEALVGVINLPCLGETYSGARGLGVTCNGTPVRLSDQTIASGAGDPDDVLQHALLGGGDPAHFVEAGEGEAHAWLSSRPFYRGYTDCFGHAMVLRGAIAAMVDPGLAPWDLVASRVLVEEAGGTLKLRPSSVEGRQDAILGRSDLVEVLADKLGWS